MHTLRNIAFHRAIADARSGLGGNQFWATAHNNYLDIAILEWCKLFTDRAGMHHWRKSVTDPDEFFAKLLDEVRSDETAFSEYALSLKSYRDKFVAHLDEDNDILISRMSLARLSTQILFRRLRQHETGDNVFHDFPLRPEDYYLVCLATARKTIRGEA